jgi:TRAP-type C4-dicarboxylate transport system substrate-binding protein
MFAVQYALECFPAIGGVVDHGASMHNLRRWIRARCARLHGFRIIRRLICTVAAMVLVPAATAGMTVAAASPASASAPGASATLRVVGGLAGLNQYVRHEERFWTVRLAELTQGRYRAEIVPFDRAGIRGAELLSMVRLGTVPFGTLLLSQAAPRDAEFAAADLAGLNPDMATLRRVVAAWRPRLQTLLLQRHNAQLLAVYAYPAQALFCNRPIAGLGDLKGLGVRTSSLTQSDFMQALGAKPLTVPFAQIMDQVRSGNLDCAITGTMSGHTIGLDTVTTHLLSLPVTWGLSVFVANAPTWNALPAELRAVLQRELPRLEAAIWDEAERETAEGIRCATGRGACGPAAPGRMVRVNPSPSDLALSRELLAREVLPRWLERCGPECADPWNQRLAPVTGLRAEPR